MRRFTDKRPSPAMAVAFVALLAALSGTAVALPGTNTVDSGDIKNNTVRSRDLRNNDVRSRDIRTGNVLGSDIGNNAVTGTDVLESSLGTVPSASNATNATNATTAGNSNALGGLGAASYQRKPLWANVEPGGTIAFQSGGITLDKTATGLYFLHFGTTVADKLVTATPRSTVDTTLIAFPCGGGPGAGTCAPAFDPNTLLVRTRTVGGVDADRGFFVGVFP